MDLTKIPRKFDWKLGSKTSIQDWNAIDFLLIIFTWHPKCKKLLIWTCQFTPASILCMQHSFGIHSTGSFSGTIVLISYSREVLQLRSLLLNFEGFGSLWDPHVTMAGCWKLRKQWSSSRLKTFNKTWGKWWVVWHVWHVYTKGQRKYCSSATLFFHMLWYMAHWRRNLELKVSEVGDWK